MTKSVLVIEDNEDIRENTVEMLELAGYKTFMAENGNKGVELALKEKPSLIICDIMMPGLDGYGVLQLIRKDPQTEDIPLIFLTAIADRNEFRKRMTIGHDDFIPKPFEERDLLNVVDARLKKAALLQNLYNPSSLNG